MIDEEYFHDFHNINKNRYTDYISYNTAINILHTFDYAKFCGKPLNVAVTINFYNDYSTSEKFKNIRKKLFRWMKAKRKRSGYPPDQLWAFSIENPHQNVHVHFVCHVEDELRKDFEIKIKDLVRIESIKTEKNQILFKDINVLTDKIFANYMIKGVHPDTAKILHIGCGYQGRIFGQRARSCMKLSRTARRRADFHAPIHRHLWISLHPHLVAGMSLALWDKSKVIPNAAIVRGIDNIFDNFGEENEKLLESGLKLKPTGHRRYRKGRGTPKSTSAKLRSH
ncbi:hypothetical protein O9X94_23435 [Agrobacterium leguminum]|uniref:Uncharacterized protein n=1 Tax=Agrobacterium leguminum TaxID=2792015 RepID=A0A9X3KI95_9HYPH|nr:hypothetical protein [Agrobacterium leguminum]MCZ7912290.1 hypothetical protein [Agrobacterium leguminum]